MTSVGNRLKISRHYYIGVLTLLNDAKNNTISAMRKLTKGSQEYKEYELILAKTEGLHSRIP